MLCEHLEIMESPEDGHAICGACGEILSEEIIYNDQKASSKTKLQYTSNLDLGLSSIMSGQSTQNLKKIPKKTLSDLLDSSRKAKACSALSKNKFRGILEIQRLCNLLQLPPFIEPVTRANFIKFSNEGHLKGRNLYSCILSFLVICAAEENIPLSINEALKTSNVSRRRFNRDYYAIYNLYSSAPKISAESKVYLAKHLNFIDHNWEKYPLFYKKLQEVLKKLEVEAMVGRIAIVTSVAVIYELLKINQYSKVDQFLNQVSINKVTLNSRWAELLSKNSFLANGFLQN